MVMLSKRELEQMNEAIQNRSNYEHQVILLRSEFDTIWLNTLALYDERDNMKAGIEKLREKWKRNIGVVERDLKWQLENGTNNLTEKNIEITKNELKVLREWVADLASISGKEEK